MEKLYNLPQNQTRKLLALKRCIAELEGLQRGYAPIFNEDPIIKNLLEQMQNESDKLTSTLREREDALELLEKG